MPSHQKRLHNFGPKSKLQNVCRVCNEVIKGYCSSYGGLSCSSCRVFFRRQISKNRTLYSSCFYTHSACTITPTTRNYCQYCRFQKCLATGMDPKKIQLKNRPKFSSSTEELFEKAVSLAVELLEIPASVPTLLAQMPKLLNLTLTYEEVDFCEHLKVLEMSTWRSFPLPQSILECFHFKAELPKYQFDEWVQVHSERFVQFANNLSIFQRWDSCHDLLKFMCNFSMLTLISVCQNGTNLSF